MNKGTLENLLLMTVPVGMPDGLDGGLDQEISPEFRMSVLEIDQEKGVRVIIRPHGWEGETMEYWVKGDSLRPLGGAPYCGHAVHPFRRCPQCLESPCLIEVRLGDKNEIPIGVL